jgi:hypothetical protein
VACPDERLSSSGLELDRVELLVDVRVVADQVPSPAEAFGKLVAERDDAEPLAGLVPDPLAGRFERRKPPRSSSMVAFESARFQMSRRTITTGRAPSHPSLQRTGPGSDRVEPGEAI